jgi:hypothetical protein
MATIRERDYSEWRKLRSITMKEDKRVFSAWERDQEG